MLTGNNLRPYRTAPRCEVYLHLDAGIFNTAKVAYFMVILT